MKPAPANVCHPILANRARVSNQPNCAAPGLHPDRRRGHAGNRRGSAAYHARSADRSRRVGPGRPARCPRRTPGEARRRNFGFWLRAGLPRPSKELRGGWIPRISRVTTRLERRQGTRCGMSYCCSRLYTMLYGRRVWKRDTVGTRGIPATPGLVAVRPRGTAQPAGGRADGMRCRRSGVV